MDLSSTLTTMALYHSRLRWFEACSSKPTPRGLPSSLAQHDTGHHSPVPWEHTLQLPRPRRLLWCTCLDQNSEPAGWGLSNFHLTAGFHWPFLSILAWPFTTLHDSIPPAPKPDVLHTLGQVGRSRMKGEMPQPCRSSHAPSLPRRVV